MGNSDLIITASGNYYDVLSAFDCSNLVICVHACVLLDVCAQDRSPRAKPQISIHWFKKCQNILADPMSFWALKCHENHQEKVNRSS